MPPLAVAFFGEPEDEFRITRFDNLVDSFPSATAAPTRHAKCAVYACIDRARRIVCAPGPWLSVAEREECPSPSPAHQHEPGASRSAFSVLHVPLATRKPMALRTAGSQSVIRQILDQKVLRQRSCMRIVTVVFDIDSLVVRRPASPFRRDSKHLDGTGTAALRIGQRSIGSGPLVPFGANNPSTHPNLTRPGMEISRRARFTSK